MKGFLLDTNVVSELRKRERASAQVRAWFQAHRTEEFWLSVLVVGELRRGVELVARRDHAAASALRAWLDSTVHDYSDRILPVTLAVSEKGRAALERLAPIQRQVNDVEFGVLSRKEFEALTGLVDRLIESGSRAVALQNYVLSELEAK